MWIVMQPFHKYLEHFRKAWSLRFSFSLTSKLHTWIKKDVAISQILSCFWNIDTPLLTKRDWHQHDGDQFHLFLVLLGALGWSRLVAPLGPSNFFQSLYHRGDHMKIQEVSQQP